MNRKLFTAFNALDTTKKNKETYIPGILGFTLGGNNIVDVPNRVGYVYVRLHSNLNEVVQVYNDKVSPVYGLPVLVVRDDVDATRYRIYGRDTGAYDNWQTASSYIPRHGDQHSFGNGDITWVHDQQFTPLLVYPSGTLGAGMVMIAPDLIWHNSSWMGVGGTGTASLLSYKPTGSTASLVMVSIDSVGNPKLTAGSSVVVSITGGYALMPYLPTPAATDIPLAAVRLVSGTSAISWDNIYDLRSFANDLTAAGSTGSAQVWETQMWTPDKPLPSFVNIGWYIATQNVTLKKVTIRMYTGEVTDSPNHTDFNIKISGSTVDTPVINASGTYDLYTYNANTALVRGDYVQVYPTAHVAPNSELCMIIFEIER